MQEWLQVQYFIILPYGQAISKLNYMGKNIKINSRIMNNKTFKNKMCKKTKK